MLKVKQEEDELLSDEIDRRIEDFEQGRIIPLRLTFDELADRAREKYKKRIAQDK